MTAATVSLIGGLVFSPLGEFECGDVHVADGYMIDAQSSRACRKYHVLPGIVDIHGDAFELELYPSLLHAIEYLVDRGVLPFNQAWNLVSKNPADAMEIDDRGAIEAGHRADLIVLDCSSSWRIVYTTIAGGKILSFGR